MSWDYSFWDSGYLWLPCLPFALLAWTLTQVIDEEKSQTKGLLYLIQIIGATAFIEHDLCHTYWNIFKRSTSRVKLSLPIMKATIACNSNQITKHWNTNHFWVEPQSNGKWHLAS
jgi:hypothetical protein